MLPINMSKKLSPQRRLRRKQGQEDGDGESTGTSNAHSAEIDVSQRLDSEEAVTTLPHIHDRKKPAADTKDSSFQYKLYDILQCDDFKEILTWLPHGRSWKIIDSDALTKYVLPKYFRHSKYSSFKRQMSGWGFRRGIKVNEYNEYNHPMFIRDKPELLSKMKRRMQKRKDKAKLHSGSNINSNDGKMPATISIPTQATSSDLLIDSIGRGSLINDINQTNPGIHAMTTDQAAVTAENPLIAGLNHNRLSSELSGLYSYANQIRSTSYQHALHHPAYAQSFGPQYYPTPLNILQHNTSDLPLRNTTQTTLENQIQSRSSNIQLSDYMNRLPSNNPIAGSVLGQMTIYPSHGRTLSGLNLPFSDFHRLEQLSQLNGQRADPNSMATLGNSMIPQLHNFQVNVDRIMQNSPLRDSNLRVMDFTNGIQGQTNLNVDTLEGLRSVLSILSQTQNNPTNFQR